MKTLIFVCLAVLCTRALAQDDGAAAGCKAEHEAAKACVKGVFDAAKEAREAKKAAAGKCFTDNGCTAPERKPREKNETREAEKAARRESWKQKMECKKNVFKNSIKPKLEACVQKSVPDFTIPEMGDRNDTDGKRGGWGHGGGWGRKGGHRGGRKGGHRGGRKGGKGGDICEKKAKFWQDACPTEEGRTAAQACLKALHGNKGDRQDGGGMRACFNNSISQACKDQAKKVKEAICSCATEGLEDDDIMNALNDCRNDDDDDDDADDDDDDDDEELEHTRNAAKRMVKMFCHKDGWGKGGKGRGGHGKGGKGRRDGKGRP